MQTAEEHGALAADERDSRLSDPAAAVATTLAAARFLLQAQFHASDASISALRSQGYAAWLSA